MFNESTPAKFYRATIRSLCLLFVPLQNEAWKPYFRSYLEENWQKESENLGRLEANNGSSQTIVETRISLFIFAVGLVTYGRLDVIRFMLRHIPQVGKLSRMTKVVLDVLPLPERVVTQRDWEVVANWVEEHYDELEWEAETEKFVFKEC